MKVGILGGGQLGRMLALAGHPMNIFCRVFEPAEASSAARVTERIRGEFSDRSALERFAEGLDVVTYEFENVPVETARLLRDRVPVRPSVRALEVSQDRLIEKNFVRELKIPVPNFAAAGDAGSLTEAVRSVGTPAVLKCRRFGYDGKGQCVIRRPEEAAAAWESVGRSPAILERWVEFEAEFSTIAVRSLDGEIAFYPPVRNTHGGGILRKSVIPSGIPDGVARRAEGFTRRLLEALDYVGVLAVEWFQRGDELWLNEFAPRVHNSGHWTIEGADTSQFENHLRAILGLPLGLTSARVPTVMWNLIGEMPNLNDLLRIPAVHVHDYGKSPSPGRKLGHITLTGEGKDRPHASEFSLDALLNPV